MGALIPLLQLFAPYAALKARSQRPPPAQPNLPGPTDAEVLASDLRLRRSLAGRGRGSTLLSGGLAHKPANVVMPTLIGT